MIVGSAGTLSFECRDSSGSLLWREEATGSFVISDDGELRAVEHRFGEARTMRSEDTLSCGSLVYFLPVVG